MYSRTQNENGSFDTRCLFCFMTIASFVRTERELDGLEAQHICPERLLSETLKEEMRHGRAKATKIPEEVVSQPAVRR